MTAAALCRACTRQRPQCPSGRDMAAATHAYRRSAYCALMPAAPMTFPHFAISVRKRAAHSSGVLATGS